MQSAGTKRRSRGAMAGALVIIALAAICSAYVLHRRTLQPSTDDATIDADVIHIAAAVGGRIAAIAVTENMQVAKGDLLFQIDPLPYQLALAQTQADLELAEAALDTQRRVLSTQRSAATVARAQVQRAVSNLELASRTVQRLTPLAAQGFVPAQQLDQAQTVAGDAVTSLAQAREQQAAAEHAKQRQESTAEAKRNAAQAGAERAKQQQEAAAEAKRNAAQAAAERTKQQQEAAAEAKSKQQEAAAAEAKQKAAAAAAAKKAADEKRKEAQEHKTPPQ